MWRRNWSPRTLPLVRPVDDPRNVGDGKSAEVRKLYHSEVRLQGREGIVRHFGACPGYRCQQRRLAGVGFTYEADVGDQFELQLDPTLLSLLARFPAHGRLVRWRGEVDVAPAPSPPSSHHQPVLGFQELTEDLLRIGVLQHRSRREPDDEVRAALACLVLPRAVETPLGPVVLAVAEVQQRGELRIGHHDHVPPVAAVPTGGSTPGYALLTAVRFGSGASRSSVHVDDGPVDEHQATCLSWTFSHTFIDARRPSSSR